MSTNKTPPVPAPKKSGAKKIVLIALAVLLVGGGGAGAGLYAAGIAPFGPGMAVDPNQPQLVPRDDVSSAQVAAALAAAQRGRPDPRVFKATYLPLEGNFTSNLAGGQAFVQVGVGVSTYYDEKVQTALRTHEMAVRSAILMTLSEADPAAVGTGQGKEALKGKLRDAVNAVLTNREGFGGIEEVHFTSFVTQ